MSSVNKVMILGNVGRDPELRYLQSGVAVANISIATSSKRKDRDSGETVEDTQWHRVTFYDRLAEIVGEYVKKGSKVFVEGRLKYGKFTNKDGVEQNTCDIIATELQMLGSPQDRQQGDGQQQRAQAPAQRPAAGYGAAPAAQRAAAPAKAAASGPYLDESDEIPF